MRYANLSNHISNSVNFGDYLQFSVIQSLYDQMGISRDDIVYIGGNEVATYSGETLLLPLNFISSIIIHDNEIAASDDIVPVFLGFSLSSVIDEFDVDRFFTVSANQEYFRRYAPIGCRDQYTFNIFKSLNIPCYLNGCLTATLPKRDTSNTASKVFFADAPLKLKNYIPSRLFEDCEFVTQQAYFSNEELSHYESVFRHVDQHYANYRNNAKLVITSRLHVAVPCLAMNIPVIFAKDHIDQRFSWLERLIPLYSFENYHEIDWNPQLLDYSEIKRDMINLAISRIQDTDQDISSNLQHYYDSKAEKITNFYLDRKKSQYYNSHEITHKNTKPLISELNKLLESKKYFNYVLWGANKNIDFWIDFLTERYPSATLNALIDTYKTGTVGSIPICQPDYIRKHKPYVIITAVSAAGYAVKFLKELNYKADEYFVVVDEFITAAP